MKKRLVIAFSFIMIFCMLCNSVAYSSGSVSLSLGFPLATNDPLWNLTISIAILYNDAYHENVLLAGEELTLELTAKNAGLEVKMIQFFGGCMTQVEIL